LRRRLRSHGLARFGIILSRNFNRHGAPARAVERAIGLDAAADALVPVLHRVAAAEQDPVAGRDRRAVLQRDEEMAQPGGAGRQLDAQALPSRQLVRHRLAPHERVAGQRREKLVPRRLQAGTTKSKLASPAFATRITSSSWNRLSRALAASFGK